MSHRFISPSALLLLAILALPLAPVWGAPPSCENTALLKLPDTTITSVTTVAEGKFPLPGGLDAPAQGAPHPLARRSGAVLLQAFCRVRLTVTPAIKIEVWLPSSGWNGNFEAVGNGGKAGEISYPAMATALKAGYAVASTDTGHGGSEAETRWALGHPELVNDFAYRAIHEMTVTTTKVIEAFYGTGPRFSYFNGCSTGGRQGLMEAQRYPDDYNGILSGDPVIYYTHLQAAAPFSVALLALRDPESYIPVGKLSAIEGAAVAACDAVDGVKDGLLEDPRKCSFRKDPSVVLCNGSDSPTCLTTKQFDTLKKIYGGFHDANGHQIYPGSMPGHETGWGFIGSADPSKPFADTAAVGAVGFFKYFVFEDPHWDFRTWNYERDMPFTDEKLASLLNATDPNLKPFQAHGGKLILYHGWTDPTVSPLETIDYYTSVVATTTGAGAFGHETEAFLEGVNQTEGFIRLFMVPGMDHCGGGPGPNTFDAFGPLVNWVEHKQAPGKIIASHLTAGEVDRTRPLCPYPMTSQYTGQGSTDDAASFVCKLPAAGSSY